MKFLRNYAAAPRYMRGHMASSYQMGMAYPPRTPLDPYYFFSLAPLTMKEVGLRIYNKFGKDLEIRKEPKAAFTPSGEANKFKPITKFPDNFELTEEQIKNIKENTTINQSNKRILEVAKILSTNQEEWEETTMIDNPVTIGLRKTLQRGFDLPFSPRAAARRGARSLNG